MDMLKIIGGQRLKGEVSISGSKNASLPILLSALLAKGRHEFINIPNLRDMWSMFNLLNSLGVSVEIETPSTKDFNGPSKINPHTFFLKNKTQEKIFFKKIILDVPEKLHIKASYDFVKKMRASVLCLGPLLARMKKAQVSFPGGCAIGLRPVNYHIQGLQTLGATIEIKKGYICGSYSVGKEEKIVRLPMPSVGATENILMVSVLSEGRVVRLSNTSIEPEVLDLIKYLVKMGAKIQVHIPKHLNIYFKDSESPFINWSESLKESQIVIVGVSKLQPNSYTVISDRIEAGTLLIAGAMTKGEVTLKNISENNLSLLIENLKKCGFSIDTRENSIFLEGIESWNALDIQTEVYPGFPTDLQAQWMALMTQAKGRSKIIETIFENRFMHVPELHRLGAHISVKGSCATVRGEASLKGGRVMATDLRAGVALVIAGLVAKGTTEVARVYHLDRGYEKLDQKLSYLGAKIQRVSES